MAEGTYNPFLEFIKDRIRHNKNCIIVIVGGTGSGKSWAALSLAEALDPEFTTDNITFSAKKFIKLIRKDFPPGSVLMFDEGGVDLSAREFMSKKNRILSKILQTVRYKNHIIILTVPDLKFIDTHARKLAHLILQTAGIKRSEGLSKLRAYTISVSPLSGDIYYPHPTVYIPTRGVVKVKDILIPKPSVRVRHAYEKLKHEFGDNLYTQTSRELDDVGGVKDLTETEQAVFYAHKYSVPDVVVAESLGIQPGSVRKARSNIRQKGYYMPVKRPRSNKWN
jgi:hypothetical protein